MVPKVFVDGLDCDLWKEARRSKQTLLSPGLLPESASESFNLCVHQSTTGCKYRRNAIIFQFDVSHSDTWDFLGRLQNIENLPRLKKSNFPYSQSINSAFPLKSQYFQADF